MRTSPRIFVENPLEKCAKFALSKDHAHYIFNVMRQKENDNIIVFNGVDGEWIATIKEAHKKSIVVECTEQSRIQIDLPEISLFFAPIKGHRNDNIIEKATEIGVKYICPIITERTIVRKPNIEKYRLTTIEAAEQCEGLNLPKIANEVNLQSAINEFQGDAMFFADEAGGGEFLKDAVSQNHSNIALLVGPEGGFSEKEREFILQNKKIIPISLGPRILRADTAAIAGLTLLQSFWGDWK